MCLRLAPQPFSALLCDRQTDLRRYDDFEWRPANANLDFDRIIRHGVDEYAVGVE